jgi:hypothetical protein
MPTLPYHVLIGVRFSNKCLSVLSYGGAIADKLMGHRGGKVIPINYFERFSVRQGEILLLSKEGDNGFRLNMSDIIIHESDSDPDASLNRFEFLIESAIEELNGPEIRRIGVVYGYRYNVFEKFNVQPAKFIREKFLNINIGEGTEQAFFHVSNKAPTEKGKIEGEPLDYYNTIISGANKPLNIMPGQEEDEIEYERENLYINIDIQRYYKNVLYEADLYAKHKEHVKSYINNIYTKIIAEIGLE